MKAKQKEQERGPASKPLSLYPLGFEEVIRDVLTIKPPPKGVKKTGKRSKAAHD